MKQQKRLVLEFLIPPLLSSLPFAIETSVAVARNPFGELNAPYLFFLSAALGSAAAAIFSGPSALFAEAVYARGLDPKSIKAVGMWATLGLISGITISTVFLTSESLIRCTVTYSLAWTFSAIIICKLSRKKASSLIP